MQALALLIGFILVGLLGTLHHTCLRLLGRLTGRRDAPDKTILLAFLGLLVLHTLEILLFAGAYRVLLEFEAMGALGGGFDQSWGDLVYFSGINFTTLGYTQIEASGALRLVSMMQGLGGFMVLTWSATFIYSHAKK